MRACRLTRRQSDAALTNSIWHAVINQAARWTIGSKPNANSDERPKGEREGVDPMPQMTAMGLTAERPLVLERRPVPTPRPTRCSLDAALCGICGSDLVAHIQFLEDSYGTVGSFTTGGATRFHSDPSGQEVEA
jgi:hypothetical protein